MPPGSTRSATASTPASLGSRESRNSSENGALVAQRRPVGGEHLDLVVVVEDLRGGVGQLRVELGGQDLAARADAGAQPRRADAAAGAELGQRAGAGRGQRGQQPAGLVAAERDVAGPAGDVEGARDDRRAGRGGRSCATSLSHRLGSRQSAERTSRIVEHRAKGRARAARRRRTVWLHHAERASYLSSAAARPDSDRPPRRGGSACALPPAHHPPRARRRPRPAPAPYRVNRHPALCSIRWRDPRRPVHAPPAVQAPHPLQHDISKEKTDVRHVPRVGPGQARPREPDAAPQAVQAALDLRDNGGQRPDDN